MQKENKDSMDKLEVTVIPVDDEPYSKIISLPSSMMSKCKQSNFQHHQIGEYDMTFS